MGAWGLGLFQPDYGHGVIDELMNESRLRLNDSDWQWLLHPKDPDQVCQHLESGSLDTCRSM